MIKIFKVLKPLVAGFAMGVMASTQPASADEIQSGRITVSGQAMVDSAPDMAQVTVGVTSQARTADAALSANTERMQGLMAALQGRGLPKADIQTSNLSLQPVWNNGSGQSRKITGYQVSNQVHVQVKDLTKLGGLLDELVQGGANNFYGLSFGLQDPQPTRDQALGLAVTRARAKAQLLATAAGVELGRLVDMREAGGGMTPPPMMRAVAMEMDAAPISEGEVSTSASVTLVYEIKEAP